ncbi:MAG: tetratricopeptide repeat protein [bacterium]|nr:tetratricopeptide repeat protein [bacterium]
MPAHPGYSLVGREKEMANLRAQLTSGGAVALSALNGLPGVGKTALALALAYDPTALEHFTGGMLWAGLGRKPDVDSLLNQWAAAMGADLSRERSTEARARRLALALQERTEGRPVLLVVDDAWAWEHACPFREITLPGCAYLLTTRDAEVARKFAGQVSSVNVLTDKQAVELLAERCPEAEQADPEGLRELAGAVGGLPLALTLMAAELKAKAGQARWVRAAIDRLRAVKARLAMEETMPRPGLEDVPNTLRAIVEISVEALEPEGQAAFAALAAFAPKPADFGREAALAVWDMPEDSGDTMLQRLTGKGLLEISGEDRLHLHQVLSAVATVRLDKDTEPRQRQAGYYLLHQVLSAVTAVWLGKDIGPRQRHAGYYLDFVNTNPEDWQRIESELDQVRQGWNWTSAEAPGAEAQVLAYVSALGVFFERRGLWQDSLAWNERGLTAARVLGQQKNEAALLNNIGRVYDNLGEKERAMDYYGRALPLSRAVGDRAGEAATLNNIGQVYDALGEKERALDYFGQSLPLFRAVGDRAGEAVTLFNIAMIFESQEQDAKAVALLEQVVAIDEAIKHPDLESARAALERIRSKMSE